MRVLVTGGSGLLGVQLVQVLADRGHEVISFDVRHRDVDFRRATWGQRVRFEEGDIADGDALLTLCREREVGGIAHTAALMNEPVSRANPGRSFRINVEGTLNVLEIARTRGLRCVCLSSQSVYGARQTMDTILPDDVNPWLGSLYASEKMMCEVLIHSYREVFGVDAVIFRPNQMYGPAPTQFRTIMDQLLKKALRGEPIVAPSGGDFPVGWTYAADMATAIASALERPALRNPIFNIEEGRLRTVGELGQIIKDLVPGSRVDIGPGFTMDGFSLPPRRGMGDTRAATEELGFDPTPLEEGVRVYVEWLRANPEVLIDS